MRSKYTIVLITVCLVLAGVSCKKILSNTPTDFVTQVNYFNSESEVNIALAGVYDPLQRNEMYGKALHMDLTMCDEGFYRLSSLNTGPLVYNYDATDITILQYWTALYDGINRANIFLENVDRATMDATNKNVAKGEVLFLRAYYYFLLVRDFGAVPLKLSSTKSVGEVNIARTPIKDVYAQILQDMTTAEGMVRTWTSWGYPGHVTKTAIEAILARVCLTMASKPLQDVSKYQDALNWAKKVVDSKEHSLNPDYKQIFINIAQDKYDVQYKESMWEVEFFGNRVGTSFDETGGVGRYLGPTCTDIPTGYCYGNIHVTSKIINMYANNDVNDVRRDWNIAPYKYTGSVKTLFAATNVYDRTGAKFYREYETLLPRDQFSTPQNWPVIRYAEVLLIYAEAENELNGPTAIAHQYLNMVRARAKTFQYTGAKLITDKSIFRQAVMDERARELAFEGARKYDLIRTGTLVAEMKAMSAIVRLAPSTAYPQAVRPGDLASDRNLLLPIPSRELSLNSAMTQNPGW
ncbi:MAG: RagB/SusD family nutrient uptake outer membrane protein [Bacteroidota bacterium]